MSNWLEPREFNMFPTDKARKAAVQTVFLRVRRLRFFLAFIATFVALRSVIGGLEYALFGRLLPWGPWGDIALAGVTGGLTGVAVMLLFRRRRALECRRLLCEQGVPVCLHCGYDLRGQTEPRCPECGREFDPALLNLHQPASPPAGRGGP